MTALHKLLVGRRGRREFFSASLAALAGGPLFGQHVETQARAPGGNPAAKDLRQSQLFVDDTWIEETSRLERAWESAEIFPEPVLRPEKPWEGQQIVISGGSV